MEAQWLIVTALGAVAVAVAELGLAKANPAHRLPVWRRPPESPVGAIALRVFGVALIVGAAVSMAPGAVWAVLLFVAAWVPTILIRLAHNRRVATSISPVQ